jgi:serine/threonine-protein kinase RsbW
MRPGSLSTKFDINLYETERLNQMVRQFGEWHGVPLDAVFVVSLSLDELVTNIVVHAGKKDPRAQEIVLRLKTVNKEVQVELEDDGCAFNPLELPEPDLNAALQDRDPGGLGIHLARTLMDCIHYSRVGRRNLLTLTKRVA